MTRIVEAAVGDNTERSGDTFLENPMVCDVLMGALVSLQLLVRKLNKGFPFKVFINLLMVGR